MLISSDFESDMSSPEGKLEYAENLPGGAWVVRSFDIEQISQYPAGGFRLLPGGSVVNQPQDLVEMAAIASENFPGKRIDTSVHREPFSKGNPASFSTHVLGIHADEVRYGFFILSTDEATIIYGDADGSTPKQARPGDLVYVPPGCFHSPPIPSHDGVRVRVKLIPQDIYE